MRNAPHEGSRGARDEEDDGTRAARSEEVNRSRLGSAQGLAGGGVLLEGAGVLAPESRCFLPALEIK